MTLQRRLVAVLALMLVIGLVVADVVTYASVRSFLYGRADATLGPGRGAHVQLPELRSQPRPADQQVQPVAARLERRLRDPAQQRPPGDHAPALGPGQQPGPVADPDQGHPGAARALRGRPRGGDGPLRRDVPARSRRRRAGQHRRSRRRVPRHRGQRAPGHPDQRAVAEPDQRHPELVAQDRAVRQPGGAPGPVRAHHRSSSGAACAPCARWRGRPTPSPRAT